MVLVLRGYACVSYKFQDSFAKCNAGMQYSVVLYTADKYPGGIT